MKKFTVFGCVAACAMLSVFSLTGCGKASEPASQESGQKSAAEAASEGEKGEYTFTVSNFYSTVNNHSLLTQAWCDEITERSNGRVTFEYYPGASLVSAANSYDSVVNGIVDIAMTATANNPGVFPVMSFLELPQGYPDGWVGTQVCNDFVAKFELDEFSSVKLLYTHTVSPLVIMGNVPIEKADDFKGTIIRTGSELATATVAALGAQSYSCQITELYEALTKNIVDAAISGKDILDGFSINEVCDYVIDDPSYGKIGVVATFMNQQKWDSLPEDLQQIFTEVSAEFAEQQGKCWKYEDLTAYENFEKKGGRVLTLSPEVSAELADRLAPVNQDYIAGLNLPEEKVKEYQAYITERIEYWKGQTPSDSEILEWGSTYLQSLNQE